MKRLLTTCLSIIVLQLAAASPAAAQHVGDIAVGVIDDAVTTGSINPDQTIAWSDRLFLATLGSSDATSNPGFDAAPGAFPSGSRVGFNALAGLQVWDGEAFIPADGESMTISYFTFATVTVEDEPMNGFDLNVDPNGAWHRHFTFLLDPADGEPAPEAGVYLLQLELYALDPGLQPLYEPSAPFFIVFDHDAPPADVGDAIAWIQDAYIDPAASCPADLTSDSAVNADDLFVLLGAWGDCSDCAADLTGDDAVDADDLFTLLGAWGACP